MHSPETDITSSFLFSTPQGQNTLKRFLCATKKYSALSCFSQHDKRCTGMLQRILKMCWLEAKQSQALHMHANGPSTKHLTACEGITNLLMLTHPRSHVLVASKQVALQ